MKIILLVGITLGLLPRALGQEIGRVTQCTIEFKITNAGMDVTGTFNDVHAEVSFNENRLDESYIIAKAKSESVQTGISIRDKHLRRSDYFDVQRFPEITVESRSLKRGGNNRYTGTFVLIVKGIRKVIAIPFNMKRKGALMTLSGDFEINRLEFGLGEKSSILDETVRIHVVISLNDTATKDKIN